MSSTARKPEALPPQARLAAFVRDLGVPVMGESSVKLAQGALLRDRYLLSVQVGDLTPAAQFEILALALELGLPAGRAEEVGKDLELADVLHFGFERSATGSVLKLYCEFAAALKRDWNAARARNLPLLVHRAVKWDPARPGSAAISEYVAHPALTGEEINERIAVLYGEEDTPAVRLVQSLHNRARGRVAARDLLFLEVSEEGTDRQSFDLKLYDAEFALAAIIPARVGIGAQFDLPQADRTALEDLPERAVLGHVAGGRGRDGTPFLTLYFDGGPR